MKKIIGAAVFLVIFFLPVLSPVFLPAVKAATPTPTPLPAVDSVCVNYILTHEYGLLPPCNETCADKCLKLGQQCLYVDGSLIKTPDHCFDLEESSKEPIAKAINVFGIDIPYDKAIWVLGRAGLLMVFAVISLTSIGLGLYGMYLRSTSQGEPEKIEESSKIFRNAVVGLIISFSAVLITQFFALTLGINDDIFDLRVIPKLGLTVSLAPDEVATQTCRNEQHGILEGAANSFGYDCVNGRWVPGNPAEINITKGGACSFGTGGRIGKDKDDVLYLCKQTFFGTVWVKAN